MVVHLHGINIRLDLEMSVHLPVRNTHMARIKTAPLLIYFHTSSTQTNAEIETAHAARYLYGVEWNASAEQRQKKKQFDSIV